jgi:hypothetical protein
MEVGKNDPEIAISWADDATLHRFLGVAGLDGAAVVPVAQRANAAASGVAIRTRFSNLVVAENANSAAPLGGGLPSFMFFHHLLFFEYSRVVEKFIAGPNIRTWGSALEAVL